MAHRSAAFILATLVLLLGTAATSAAPVRSEAGEPVCRDAPLEQVLLDVRLVTVSPDAAAELGLRSEVSVQSVTPVSFAEAMPVGRRGLEGWDYVPMPRARPNAFLTLALLEQRRLVRAGPAQRVMTQSGHAVRVTLVDESLSVQLVVKPTAGVDNVAVEFSGDLSVNLTVTDNTILLCRTRLQAACGHCVYVAIATKVMR